MACLKLRNSQSLANILILNELLSLVGKSHQVNNREPLGIFLTSAVLDFFPKLRKLNVNLFHYPKNYSFIPIYMYVL